MKKKQKNREAGHGSGIMTTEEFDRVLEKYQAEDLYEFMLSPELYGGESVADEEIGYCHLMEAAEAMHENDCAERRALVTRYDDTYYYFELAAMIRGNAFDDWEVPERYGTMEEITERIARAKKEYVRPVPDQIRMAKESLPYDPEDVFIKYWQSGLRGSFRIYYRRLLVAEHMYDSINTDVIREAVRRLEEFQKVTGITVTELYKPGREWNDNQRYYSLAGIKDGLHFHCKIHIPSALQGRFRYVTDVIQNDRSRSIEKALAAERRWQESLADGEKEAASGSDYSEYYKGSVLTEKEKESLDRYLFENDATSNCNGDYALTEEWMDGQGIGAERRRHIFAELQSRGGCCDCEIRLNYFR